MRPPRILFTAAFIVTAFAQQPPAPNPSAAAVPAPTIEEYNPKAALVIKSTDIKKSKYPFIDIHTHQERGIPDRMDQLVKDMDSLNMRAMISSPVNGSWGDRTKKTVEALRAHPQAARFATFTNIDLKTVGQPGYSERVAAQLEEDLKNGAVGVKVWKNLGLNEMDAAGKRVPVDDARLDAAWKVAAKYKAPVLIHTADPKPLFDPMDKDNERWLELRMRPNRARGPNDPTWDQLMKEQHNLFAKNPQTIFINAHFGWMGHDLQALGQLLDQNPNVYLEIAAMLGELGRQPRAAQRFFIKYQDRILFGKDTYNVGEYAFYFRMLETDDEYFDNIRRYHGLWKLYALALPDDVLKKVYYKNALKLFPAIGKAGFPD